MLRVACFVATAFPVAEASWPADAEIVLTSPDDDLSYWRPLAARWDGSADLVVIEQDIEIHQQAVPQLEACPSPWCTFPHLAHSWGNPRLDITGNAGRAAAAGALCESLACTKFSAGLQRAVPLPIIPVHYSVCDGVIAGALKNAGFTPCLHEPWVVNHHWTATRLWPPPFTSVLPQATWAGPGSRH